MSCHLRLGRTILAAILLHSFTMQPYIQVLPQGCATGAMALHVAPHLPLKRQGTYFQRQCHRCAVRNDCLISQLQYPEPGQLATILARGKSFAIIIFFCAHILEPPYGSRSSQVQSLQQIRIRPYLSAF